MTGTDLLRDNFTRIRDTAHRVVDGLSPADLLWRPDPGANPIAWLVWHTARVQDDHVAEVAAHDQCWTRDAWPARFGLAPDTMETGFGHTPEEVARVRPTRPEDLLDYLDAVTDDTLQWLPGLTVAHLDEVVDESWDPPVTLGVRLVSVTADSWAHLGQAAYVRGLLDRAGDGTGRDATD
jgi:hypothetical protein